MEEQQIFTRLIQLLILRHETDVKLFELFERYLQLLDSRKNCHSVQKAKQDHTSNYWLNVIQSNDYAPTHSVFIYSIIPQEPQLLLRNIISYLLIYSFKWKSAFDTCLFWQIHDFHMSIMQYRFWVVSVSVGVESCKIVFLCGHLLFTSSDTSAVGCIV